MGCGLASLTNDHAVSDQNSAKRSGSLQGLLNVINNDVVLFRSHHLYRNRRNDRRQSRYMNFNNANSTTRRGGQIVSGDLKTEYPARTSACPFGRSSHIDTIVNAHLQPCCERIVVDCMQERARKFSKVYVADISQKQREQEFKRCSS
jgi:hypothetical protein